PTGPVISTLAYAATGGWNKFVELGTSIQNPGGKHDLYFVFVKADTPNRDLFSLDWLQFGSATASTAAGRDPSTGR
ncbi:MAG: carbohydrate-binding protein, partial [Cytophagaceae bacterium]